MENLDVQHRASNYLSVIHAAALVLGILSLILLPATFVIKSCVGFILLFAYWLVQRQAKFLRQLQRIQFDKRGIALVIRGEKRRVRSVGEVFVSDCLIVFSCVDLRPNSWRKIFGAHKMHIVVLPDSMSHDERRLLRRTLKALPAQADPRRTMSAP